MSGEKGDGPPEAQTTRARWALISDADVVAGIQRGDPWALDEFIVRFGRLLFDRARRLGIPRARCEDTVVRVIEAVGQRLAAGEIQIQSSVAAYLVRCFQREYARAEKTEQRRARILRERMQDSADTGEQFVQGSCSEYVIATSRGSDWEPAPIALAVERLATMIEDELTADEERLLTWVSNEVDLGALAREFGLKYDTLAKRIRRLRVRMRTAALRHAEHFALEERQALVRFFTRADRLYEAAVLTASIDTGSVSPVNPIDDPASRKDQ
jgi:hypothetical protein